MNHPSGGARLPLRDSVKARKNKRRINGKKLAIRVDMPFCGSTVNRVTALVHRRI